MTISIKVDGVNRVENKLRGLASKLPKITQDASYKWAQEQRAMLKSLKPSPARNTKKMRWKSEKQRRYVMARIRDGSIKVPYQKTGNLANRWSARRVDPAGAEIRNSASYAKYVVGQRQYYMHAGRWYKARDEVLKKRGDLTKMIRTAIVAAWRSGA